MPHEPNWAKRAIADLIGRGLVQYDHGVGRYDLHPVIRALVVSRMGTARLDTVGAPIIKYFQAKPNEPAADARTIEDLAIHFSIQRVLLALSRYEEAYDLYRGDFSNALLFNLDAVAECQALLRQYFPNGWRLPPVLEFSEARSYLYNDAAIALLLNDADTSQFLYQRAIEADLSAEDELELGRKILNFANYHCELGHLAPAARLASLARDLAQASGHAESIFRAAVDHYWIAVRMGIAEDADELWGEIRARGTHWARAAYRPGDAELLRSLDLFRRGRLDDATLMHAEQQALAGNNHMASEQLHLLRGRWELRQGDPRAASETFARAVSMARTAGRSAPTAEAWRLLARLQGNVEFDGETEAKSLEAEAIDDPEFMLAMAEVWRQLDNDRRAAELALIAHASAASEGWPFVWRAELDHAAEILTQMGVECPKVAEHNPESQIPYAWEAGVREFSAKLRASRQSN